jgi:large subunit ribosomal protein L15
MLDRLSPSPGSTKRRKRVGRGPGSGLHKTSGRGMKGQGHRSAGRETPFWFEGGQMPLARRLPKRGFFNRSRVSYQVVNVGALSVFGDGATVDSDSLTARGLVHGRGSGIKVLGEGEAPRNLTLKVKKISAGARKKIEDAGGSVELV